MRKPDCFIVGAPRCGTTALYTYLGQRPDIFMSAQKEPHFFGTDVSSPGFVRDAQHYLSLDVFGWRQVHAIIFDDFTNDTACVYRETCKFLGVSPDFQPQFPIINANQRARRRTIWNVLSSPPSSPVRRLAGAVLPRPVRHLLYGSLKSFSVVDEQRPPLDA